MPIKFEIDYGIDLASFTVTGEITFEEISDIFGSYLKAGATRLIVHDVSKGTLKSLTSKQIDQVIGWIIEHSDKRPVGSKTAVVVAKDTDLETLKLFQQHDEIKEITWETKIFYSLYEAYEWLTKPLEKS